MKAFTKIGLLVAGSLLLANCGGWKQDPLADKSAQFEQGTKEPQKPIDEKPTKSDAVRITAPSNVEFEEGQPQEFEISGRILIDGFSSTIEIMNLSDFPGASYDSAAAKFKWKPERGYVDANSSGGVDVFKKLLVRNAGVGPAGEVLYDETSITFHVRREFFVPVINSVTPSSPRVREGESLTINVDYTDRDADPNDKSTWGIVQIVSMPGTKSAAGAIFLNSVSTLSSGRYRANYAVDLRSTDLTSSITHYTTGFVVTSRYGKTSASNQAGFDVLMSFSSPLATWVDELQIKVGETKDYQFLVVDPKQEARLVIDSVRGLPSSASLLCNPTGLGVLNCSLKWTPTDMDLNPGNFVPMLSVVMTNPDTRDTQRSVKQMRLPIVRIIPGGI